MRVYTELFTGSGKSVTAALDRYGAYVCIGNELDREFRALTVKYKRHNDPMQL